MHACKNSREKEEEKTKEHQDKFQSTYNICRSCRFDIIN
jgi:hypothetical protein